MGASGGSGGAADRLCACGAEPPPARPCLGALLTTPPPAPPPPASQLPVVVVTSFPDAVKDVLEASLASIKEWKYTAVLGRDLVAGPDEARLSREQRALVDYYLGLEAERFVGNSVSTFTAFIMLERQWLGRYSGHYNGGSVPLAIFFPWYDSSSGLIDSTK